MKNTQSILRTLLAIFAVFIPLSMAVADTGPVTGTMSLSHVRIVRLSFVQGDVAIKRASETDWTAGTVNTPIQEGFSVATTGNSFAEVEFENGSTARLGQGSQIDFTELALTPQGDKVNKLALSKGYATFHFTPEHHDQYEVDASGVAITSHGKTEFRTNFAGDALRVEVFDGQVVAEHDGKTEELGKNRVLTYDPNTVEAFNVSTGLQKDAWDKWAQARDQQAMLANNDSAVSHNGSSFGWADLDTYGDWSFFPGYGYAWAPYEPAGWSPYSAGMWSNYPGWGFTWISSEPWGWMPFHNGFWNYDASMGWFWMPGPTDAWSPAMVNWYDGPGWVGWAPIGTGGGACTINAAGCLTAVSPTTLAQGGTIRPGSPLLVRPGGLTGAMRIAAPQLERGNAIRSANALAPRSASMRSAAPVASEAAVHAAPSSVVMGREVAPDTFLAHHSFFSGAQPIHAQMGRTMGGTVPTVVGHNGEVAPDPRYHAQGVERSAESRMPMIMPHGAAAAGESAASVGPRGGVTPSAASRSEGASGRAPSNSAASTGTAPSSSSASGASAGGNASGASRSSGSISAAAGAAHR
jgi:hypothetical protein